jgi:hypothetical protein
MRSDKNNATAAKNARDASDFAKEEYSPENEIEYFYFYLKYGDDRAEYIKYSTPLLYIRDIFSRLVAHQISHDYSCPTVEPCSEAEFEAGAKTEFESTNNPEKILDENDFPATPEGFQLTVKYLNSAYFSNDVKEMRLFLHKAMLQLRQVLSPQAAKSSGILPQYSKGE